MPLIILAVGILLLFFLIVRVKLNSFISLLIVAGLVGYAEGLPVTQIIPVIQKGLGGTLGGLAIVVSFGAILGKLMAESGGAQRIAMTLINMFGKEKVKWAVCLTGFIVGIALFYEIGFVLLIPLVFTIAASAQIRLLEVGIPMAAALSVTHGFLPPHPGPIAAGEYYGANIGHVLLLGLPIAVITWYFSGYLLGQFLGRHFHVPVPDFLSGGKRDTDTPRAPASAGTVIGIMLIPMVLIFLNTGLMTLISQKVVSADATWVKLLRMLGATPIALLIAVLVALFVLGRKRGEHASALEKTVDGALGPVCSVILITGAGGMFGGVLRASGIGKALADSMAHMGISVIVGCFLVALVLRVAQGSATVALTTAAALMAPAVAAAGYNDWQLAAIVLATASGSVFASHVNDSGFWLVGRLLDMDVPTTLKTWTVNQALIAVIGFALSALAFSLL